MAIPMKSMKSAMKSAMKTMKITKKLKVKSAMKTMKKAMAAEAKKVQKAKRVTKVAKGRFARALVLRGSKEKTVGGLRKESLMKNSRGKIVSKRQSASGKRNYKNIEPWTSSVMKARAGLKITGFVAINGRTVHGKALYVKSKALYALVRAPAAANSEQKRPASASEPTLEPVPEPVPEAPAEAAAEAVPEPVAESATEPAAELAAEPAVESAAEPADESAVELATELGAELSSEVAQV